MKAKSGNVLIAEGFIRKIRKSDESGSWSVELGNDPSVYEFRDTEKQKRGENFRKLKLNAGEHVILSGKPGRRSGSYVFGYDIRRKGQVNAGGTSMIKGTVRDIAEFDGLSVVTLERTGKGRETILSVPDWMMPKGAGKGSEILFLCRKKRERECDEYCARYGEACEACAKCHTEDVYVVHEAKAC